MSASLQKFNEDQSSFKGSFYSAKSAQVMNSSNYSLGGPHPFMSYSNASRMGSPGHAFGHSIASNSKGFVPTAVSTPAYDYNNENITIRSRAEEMIRRTEELAKIAKPNILRDRAPVKKLDMNEGEGYFRNYNVRVSC